MELGEFHVDQPIPHIVQFTRCGVLQIGWNQAMKVPQIPEQIKETRVAFMEEVSSSDTAGRMLSQTMEWVQTDEPIPVSLLTTESLELRVKKSELSEANNLNYTWYVLDFTEDYIWIQVIFEEPNLISTHIDQVDTLEVYFWGVEYGYF